MCHSGEHRGRRGLGRRRPGGRWYDRENVVSRLEEYQRDLEQELADVTDLLRRLQAGEAGAAPQTGQV
jgi:hypothetical protein